jgi:MoaA/NifB/PqqE/SkfB family radical SAM enzyme
MKKQIILWVELTEACQYKCRYCYNFWRDSSPRHHRSMPPDTVKKVVDFAYQLTGDYEVVFALAGGDASAHSDCISIASDLSSIGAVQIITHGSGFGFRELDALAALPGISLQFSIPSPDAEHYAFLTGGGKLDTAVAAAIYARHRRIPVSVSSVLTAVNQGDTEELVHLSHEIGAEYLLLYRFLSAGRGIYYSDEFELAEEQFETACECASRAAQGCGLIVLKSPASLAIRQCKIGHPKITISVDGSVRICSLDKHTIGAVGERAAPMLEKYFMFWDSSNALESCACSK